MAGGAEQQLLFTLLKQFKERGWLKERGKQRTDSTHVLAAIRNLNKTFLKLKPLSVELPQSFWC
ncbi:MAG: hypothetical protein V7L21_19860 [Nostoc sp.]|uniref:hypothetical protein n=1 Tax=Nostoc sp. TaxID=1180 RepID=UPI002FF7CC1C